MMKIYKKLKQKSKQTCSRRARPVVHFSVENYLKIYFCLSLRCKSV